ncbi:MAG TPA: lipopolysaccharide assembly protein LapA domain-containing protein [Azospirillum sp.]
MIGHGRGEKALSQCLRIERETLRRFWPAASGLGIVVCALFAAVLTIGTVTGTLPVAPLFTWLLSLAAAGAVAVALVSALQVRRLRAALAEERRRLRALTQQRSAPSDSNRARSFAMRH